jgi:hypothetical protein
VNLQQQQQQQQQYGTHHLSLLHRKACKHAGCLRCTCWQPSSSTLWPSTVASHALEQPKGLCLKHTQA